VPDAIRSIFDEWTVPWFLTVAVILCAIVYVRGWIAIRRTRPLLFTVERLAAFVSGLALIWIAIGSPMDGFADASLSAHMVEHLLLMSFVPPLLLLGYPSVPLLRGLPRVVIIYMLGPLLRNKALRRLGHILAKPLTAWLLMNLFFVGWHIPAAYDFALEHEHWHEFEHICFLGSSILFWWPLIRPWPTSKLYPGWYMLPYLVGADLVNTALSAFLAFCDRPVYLYYLEQTNPFSLTPQADQATGAVIMWVLGSLVFLIPAALITMRLLQQDTAALAAPKLSRYS
jgi:putative membrane protein